MRNITLYIMVLFSIFGGIDRILNNRFGLGGKFEEGIKSIGGLALTMIGIISLAPVISQFLIPVLYPLSKITGADPSVFISSILAVDMGGYATSIEIAKSQEIAQFTGLILASMMGATISFTIPISINIISKESFPCFAKGILAGIATIPIGMIIGGMAMGINFKDIFLNIIPVIILSIIIILGLLKYQKRTIYIFNIFGKGIMIISIIGLLLGTLDFVLGIKLLPNMASFEEGIIIVGKIGIILSGAYSLVHFISNKLEKNINRIVEILGINNYACIGILTSLANSIPMMEIYDKMDDKGKILNAAFAVSGAFTFGGQLGYISSISSKIITPFILAKLSAGISGMLLGYSLNKLTKMVPGTKK